MAVGISCAGSGSSEAISVLEPLTSDAVDFVRQGALIAMAMVPQTTETLEPRVASFGRLLEKIINDKHDETMSKVGASLAQGILDAGGWNVGIMLRSRATPKCEVQREMQNLNQERHPSRQRVHLPRLSTPTLTCKY